MKVGIISDTHGHEMRWTLAYEKFFKDADLIIHSGDVLYHGPRNPMLEDYNPAGLAERINTSPVPVIIAKGNCDSEVDAMVLEGPVQTPYAYVMIDGFRIVATHGHTVETDAEKDARGFIAKVAQEALDLLEEQHIPLDQCIGVGAGVPGTIDRRRGKVLYSNNLRWEDVDLAEELGRVIPCPVRIANDADCAALGEAVAGAGKEYSDVVMFTLGGGVGGGIILNGQVFEGGIMGGSEVGHQVVRVNGRRCSCGRRGCLEAYVSVPALVRAAEEAAGRILTPAEIFRGAAKGNIDLQEIVEQYEEMLGTGIVNIVNMFRPQLILLGGAMSGHAQEMIGPIRAMMKRDCFGGEHGMIPEIAAAELGSSAGMIGAANL